MHLILDPLQYTFMRNALIGTIAIAILCAVIGSFVVLQRLAFIGEGLAHGSLAGLAIGYLLGADLYLSGSLYTLGLAVLIGVLHEKTKVAMDTAIGIIFSTSMAFGIALISSFRFYTTDLAGYLFGSVLAITSFDLKFIIGVTLGILVLVLLLFKELVFYTFDPEMAEVAGLPRMALHYLLLVMIALTVVVASQAIGVMLVTALLVIPAASAQQWASSLKKVIVLAVVFGLSSAITGLYVSYYFNVASGASIALTAALLFLFSFLLAGERRSFWRSLGLRAPK